MNPRDLYDGMKGVVAAIDRLTAAIDEQTVEYRKTTERSHATACEHLALVQSRVAVPPSLSIEELAKMVADHMQPRRLTEAEMVAMVQPAPLGVPYVPFAGGGTIQFGPAAFDRGGEDARNERPPQFPDDDDLEGYVDELLRQEEEGGR